MTGLYIGIAYVAVGSILATLIAWCSKKSGSPFEGSDWLLAVVVWPLTLYWYARGFLRGFGE